jgi:N-acetylneuraminic acid mutarotase
VVGHNGVLYSFGGSTFSAPALTDAYRYNRATSTWAALAPLPAARSAASAVSDGNYIYILNGSDSNYQSQPTLYRYDPSSNSYTVLAAPNVATAGQGAVYLNGKIYRVGGGASFSVEVYTVSANVWTPPGTVADYPLVVFQPLIAAQGGYIYSAGGALVNSHSPTAKSYRYDPASNTWDDAAVTDLPQVRTGAAAGLINGQWIIAGGYVDNYASSSAISLDLNNPGSSWMTRSSMLSQRANLGGAAIAQSFYALGGTQNGGDGVTDFQEYACGN